jgi:hypothetical protein
MPEEKIVTDVTENADELSAEEKVEGIELTDTTPTEGEPEVEEIKEVKEKKYDDDDLDRIIAKKLAIQEKKVRKEYEEKLSKYEDTESVLNAGLGTKTIEESNQKLRDFYKEQGIEIPTQIAAKPVYNDKEVEILANYEADEIISLGEKEAEVEANELAKKGYANMNPREKVVFNKICTFLTSKKDERELKSAGITEDVINSKEFQDLRSKYKGSVKEVYDLYKKLYVKVEAPASAGSLESNTTDNTKSYYSESEASRLLKKMSPEDLAKNPELLEKIKDSSLNW